MSENRAILTAAQMRDAEEALIAAGTSVESLMERAGAGAADWVFRMSAGRPVTILCGPGNNGGDGYVIARVLAERGVPVKVVAPFAPGTCAARNARKLWGGEPVEDAEGCVLVDCLFGTGLTRALSDDLQRLLLDLVYTHDHWVAVDMPSGVDSDSGALLSDGLPQYDLTIALGAWKFAHWLMPAMQICGELRLVDIGVAVGKECAALTERPRLFAPSRDAHKYTRGLLGVVGGVMPGACVLAATAGQHGGAGYVKLLADQPGLLAPDLVSERDPITSLMTDRRFGAVLIGPGLGRSAQAQALLAQVLACDLPTVCDADALVLLEPDMLDDRTAPLIVTPHAGELDVLGNAFGSVGLDRIEQVCDLAEALGAVVIAKGPDTVIAAPSQPPVLMPPASSWLSTAGTGDVLAGLVASQLAVDNRAPQQAAINGCWLHREAARLAGPALSASDLVKAVPAAYRALL